MKFDHFDFRVAAGENWDLYVSTYGYAYIKIWSTGLILKKYFPNKTGHIWINRKKINFKRLLYKTVYPQTNLKKKVVFKAGPIFDINCLYALSKNDFMRYKKYKLKVMKNQKNGKCYLKPVKKKNIEKLQE